MYERLALGFGLQVRLRIALDGLVDLARRSSKNGTPATKDPVTRQKLAQLWIDTEVFKYTGARAITKLLKGELPGPEASTGKMMWVEGHQRLQELAMELEGPYSQLTRAAAGLSKTGSGSTASSARAPTPSRAAPPRSSGTSSASACSDSRKARS
jgi:alkylation response protein AidB-like acyl-CoA dehydrogenase